MNAPMRDEASKSDQSPVGISSKKGRVMHGFFLTCEIINSVTHLVQSLFFEGVVLLAPELQPLALRHAGLPPGKGVGPLLNR